MDDTKRNCACKCWYLSGLYDLIDYMPYIKKLVFAPLFLSLVLILIYLFKLVLGKYIEVFLGTWGGLYELGLISLIIILASLSYCLYITFTQDVKYYLGLAIIGSLIPFIFLSPPLALVTAIGFFISLSVTYFNLMSGLKTYVNFQPAAILSFPVKTLNTFLVLSLSLVFYFHSNSIIATQGFKIPDPVLDWAIDLSLQGNVPVRGEVYLAQAATLSPEQLNLLKQNPQLLEQFGLSQNDVDNFLQNTAPQSIQSINQNAGRTVSSLPGMNLKDTVKTQITNSLDQLIKPYLFAIPILLAFLFYSICSFALWIFSVFLSPAILLVFYVLEKTDFIKFANETRIVKKIII